MNLFADGHDQVMPHGLKWINEPAHWQFDANQTLVMEAPALADFFVDPSGAAMRDSAPFCYAEITGDFTMITQPTVQMRSEADSACLLIMADKTQWAKICFEYAYHQPTIVTVVTRGESDDCNAQVLTAPSPFLRATRFGDCYAFHYSLDGHYWYLVRYFKMPTPAVVKVGVVTQAPVGSGCRAEFSFLDYSRIPVAQLRSGD